LLVCGFGADNAVPFASAAAGLRVPLKVWPLPEPRLRSIYGTRYILVRPDQHVCWRGDTLPAEPGRILDRVRGVEAFV
jgi:hypothetical protein